MKNIFYFMLKDLFVLEIFTFLSWLFSYEQKRFDKKVKVNSKIYDITDWTTNNYNTHIAQYHKNKGDQAMKFGQFKEYNVGYIFLQKLCKNSFLEKLYIRQKGMVSTLVLINFGRPPFGHTIKTNFITFLIFIKGHKTSFSTTFCVWFFKKNISHVIFY